MNPYRYVEVPRFSVRYSNEAFHELITIEEKMQHHKCKKRRFRLLEELGSSPLSKLRQVANDFQKSMKSKRTFEAQVMAKYDRQNGKMIKIGRGNSDIFIEESWGHSMEKMRRSYSLLFVLS